MCLKRRLIKSKRYLEGEISLLFLEVRVVDWIKDRFFNPINFEEIPETKKLAPDIDKVKHAVCKAYNIKEKEMYITIRGYFNEPRNVAIYMIRHLRNDTLRQIGKQFGIEKYSTVISIIERVKCEMKVDKGFKERVQNLAETISKSQRQTSPRHTWLENWQIGRDLYIMQHLKAEFEIAHCGNAVRNPTNPRHVARSSRIRENF